MITESCQGRADYSTADDDTMESLHQCVSELISMNKYTICFRVHLVVITYGLVNAPE